MGFVSFGDAGKDAVPHSLAGSGPPVYVLHGQAYHLISTLLPSEGKRPAYGQLYIYDPHEAAEHRVRADPGLRAQILRDLHNMLITCRNPYVTWYKHLHEKVWSRMHKG